MDPKQNNIEQPLAIRRPRGLDPRALNLDEPLFWYTPANPFTIGDSFEGVKIRGAPGTGKSSASAQTHLRSMLRKGYGGLILTAKPNEPEKVVRYCQEEGRLPSLLIVNQNCPVITRTDSTGYDLRYLAHGWNHQKTPQKEALFAKASD